MIKPAIVKVYNAIEGGTHPLKAIREALGMSQQEFATQLGVAVASVSRWERGLSQMSLTVPQMKKFTKLLREINMTIEDIPDEDSNPSKED